MTPVVCLHDHGQEICSLPALCAPLPCWAYWLTYTQWPLTVHTHSGMQKPPWKAREDERHRYYDILHCTWDLQPDIIKITLRSGFKPNVSKVFFRFDMDCVCSLKVRFAQAWVTILKIHLRSSMCWMENLPSYRAQYSAIKRKHWTAVECDWDCNKTDTLKPLTLWPKGVSFLPSSSSLQSWQVAHSHS